MSTHSIFTSFPEEHFRCLICLDVFTEPVTTPCGHNFCRTCLSQQWSDCEFYQCPKCNKRFLVKLELSTNKAMEEISSQIKRRKPEALESTDAPWRVRCDVCADFRFRASKSCLVCLASYCDEHLEPHRRVPALMRHKLTEPVENLEERVCGKHAKILEFFCRREQTCICLLCCEAEHRDHETVPVEEEGVLQKANIASKQEKIKLMIDERVRKIEEFTYSSDMRRVKTEKEAEVCEKLFGVLMGKVQEIQGKVKLNMDEKLQKSTEMVQAMIQKLEEEAAALRRKHSQLEELSQSEDHFQLLQTLSSMSETKDWSSIKVYTDLCIQTLRRAMHYLVSGFQTELKTQTSIELTRITQYKESVVFDDTTAGPGLRVLENGTRLKFYNQAESPTDTELDRFELPMVFAKNGFTSGRHYWQVEVGLRNDWHVGVALETVDRSDVVQVRKENGFFSMGKSGADYYDHGSPRRVLHLCTRPRNIGIYLDYEEGRVSFYDLSEKLHIHSYIGESFTGKVFPYFYLYSKAKKSEALVIDRFWFSFTLPQSS